MKRNLKVMAYVLFVWEKQRKPEPQDLPSIPEDDWELPKSEFTLEQQLGSGYFADVYRGKWKGTVNVAIKILKNNGMSDIWIFVCVCVCVCACVCDCVSDYLSVCLCMYVCMCMSDMCMRVQAIVSVHE